MISEAAPQDRPDRDRRNSFDAVRLAAALAVAFGHQVEFAGRPEPALGPLGISLSNTGLFVFFGLSGYLVFKSLDRDPRPWRFVGARLRRVYPGAVANALVCVLFGAAVTMLAQRDYWLAPETWSYLLHGIAVVWTPTRFDLPGVFADARWPSVDTPIWTLKYELLCYAVLLVLYSVARLDRPGAPRGAVVGSAVAALTLGYVAFLLLAPLPADVDFYTRYNAYNVLRFGMIFAGGAFYAVAERKGERWRVPLLLVPAALAAPVPAMNRAGLTLLVACCAIEFGRTPALFSRRYRRFGDLSYGIYLYAYPIGQMMTVHRQNSSDVWPVAFGSLILTLVAAVLSWHLVERRFHAGVVRSTSSQISPVL